MLERFKKKTILPSIIMLVIGMALLVFQGPSAFHTLSSIISKPTTIDESTTYNESISLDESITIDEPITFEDLSPNQIQNHMRVNVSLNGALGLFMEEYDYTNRAVSACYYIIYSGGMNEDIESVIMAIKVPSTYRSSMEELTDTFYAGSWSNEAVNFYNAEIKKMTSTELSFFKDALQFSDEEFDEYCFPYVVDASQDNLVDAAQDDIVDAVQDEIADVAQDDMINAAQNDNRMMDAAVIFATVGIVLVLVGVIWLIYIATGFTLKKSEESKA